MTDTNEDFAMDSFDDSVMESDQSETEGKTLILMQDTQSDNDSFVDDKSNGITGSSYIDALPDQAFHTVTDANDSTCCLAFYTYDKNTSSYPITHSISLISVGSVDEKLRFYTVNDMGGISYVDQVSDFSDSVVSVQFSFDGKYLAAGSYDTTVKIFQINFKESNIDIQYKHQLHGPTSDIEWIAWHPRGYALLAGSNDATLWMWLANTSTVMQVFSGHVGSVLCGGFANQGRLVVSGDAEGSLIIWDPKTGKRLTQFTQTKQQDQRCHMTTIAVHDTLPLICTGGENNMIQLINIQTLKIIKTFQGHSDTVEALSFLPCTFNKEENDTLTLLASGGLDGVCHIWDYSQLKTRMTFKHTDLVELNETTVPERIVGGITCLLWILDKKSNSFLLVTAGTDCTIRLWDIRTQKNLRVFSGHTKPILNMIYIDKCQCIVSCSDDKTVKVWKVFDA